MVRYLAPLVNVNYRQISICPEPDELLNNHKPKLQKNKILGGYDGISQYLDIQFRLLREDFVRPFRELVSEYIRTRNDPKAAKKVQNVYRNVQILEATHQNDENIYSCKFDWKPFKSTDWEVNERKLDP